VFIPAKAKAYYKPKESQASPSPICLKQAGIGL